MVTPEERLIIEAAAFGNLELLKQVAACDEEGFLARLERIRNSEGLTALHFAATEGRTEICKYLIETVKMNINVKAETGENPLFLAVMAEQLPTAAYLIHCGADVNASDSEGKTPLHYAAELGNTTLLQLLISHGADIEAIYYYGTPLQLATSNGKKEAVRILLEHNANPNSTSPLLTLTSVMLSIKAHSVACLDMLLKAGADPNTSAAGMIPLSAAVLDDEPRYMMLLLRAGANPNLIDLVGMTPIENAARAYNDDAVMILFPVTSRIPSIPDWSIHGIMSHIHSNESKQKRELKKKELFLSSKKRGEEAVKRNDYLNAVYCYTGALHVNSSDAVVLSNRSLCWANLKNGERALEDAKLCVKLRPDWPKAHYREGVAWKLLKDYLLSSEAFSKALRLDPKNKDIQKAFKEAVEAAGSGQR